MASYSVATDTHHTLTANTVDTVTLTGDFTQVLVTNDGTANPIYVVYSTTGGTPADPTVAGDNTIEVPAGQAKRISLAAPTSGWVLKLISAGAMPYSVEGS